MSSGKLAGKVAFITGAARGQGRSHAIRLAQDGADIIGVDLCADVDTIPYPGATPEDLEETRTRVEELGRRMVTHRADVRDLEALSAAAHDGASQLGSLDIVSANAGVFSLGDAESMAPEMWAAMLDINLTGAWNTASATVSILKEQGRGGSIVMTGSVAGTRAYRNAAHYVSAKHGLVGLMRSLALELGPHSIRVNSIHPGNVRTSMIDNDTVLRLMRPDLESPILEDTIDIYTTMSVLPAPWVESSDISNALAWLVSDEARYVTGVALPVDLGASIV